MKLFHFSDRFFFLWVSSLEMVVVHGLELYSVHQLRSREERSLFCNFREKTAWLKRTMDRCGRNLIETKFPLENFDFLLDQEQHEEKRGKTMWENLAKIYTRLSLQFSDFPSLFKGEKKTLEHS